MDTIQEIEEFANITRCPDWCDGDECTRWSDPGTANHGTRIRGVGRATATIAQSTGVGVPDQPPVVGFAIGRDDVDSLSAQDCRDSAAVLLAAADQLERILGTES